MMSSQTSGPVAEQPPATGPKEYHELLVAALTHSWGWVEAHATRRAQMVNLYLIATAFLTTAWATEINNHLNDLACATSITSALTAAGFWSNDLRLRKYVAAGELPLSELQDKLADAVGVASLRMTAQVKKSVRPSMRQSSLLTTVFALSFASSVAGAVYAFVR
jgi:hypothetical protein